MFWDDRQTQEKYFNFLRKLFKFESRMRLIVVDFTKPWWYLLWQQKYLVALNLLNILIFSIVVSITPLLLAQVFVSGNIQNLIWLILGLVATRFVNFALFYFDPILRLQSSRSLENSAANFFMTVDPIYHSLRSTGQIVSKVTRGSSSYESFLDLLSFDLLSLLGMIVGTVIAFWQIGFNYALIATILLIIVMFFNTFLFIARSKLFRRFRIKSDDKSKAVSLETLQQTQYIRAVFGSKEQLQKVHKRQFKAMTDHAIMWRLGGYIVSGSQIVFLLSLFVVSYLFLIKPDLDKTVALSLILSYYQVGNRINFVGNSFGRAMMAVEDIKDLFEFIRNFGSQSYPVLETSVQKT